MSDIVTIYCINQYLRMAFNSRATLALLHAPKGHLAKPWPSSRSHITQNSPRVHNGVKVVPLVLLCDIRQSAVDFLRCHNFHSSRKITLLSSISDQVDQNLRVLVNELLAGPRCTGYHSTASTGIQHLCNT